MSTPMSLSKKIENMINNSPTIAEVTSSFPSLTFSGFPMLITILNPPMMMRRNAMPPAMPTPDFRSISANLPESVGRHPNAVHTFFPLLIQLLHFPAFTPANSQGDDAANIFWGDKTTRKITSAIRKNIRFIPSKCSKATFEKEGDSKNRRRC